MSIWFQRRKYVCDERLVQIRKEGWRFAKLLRRKDLGWSCIEVHAIRLHRLETLEEAIEHAEELDVSAWKLVGVFDLGNPPYEPQFDAMLSVAGIEIPEEEADVVTDEQPA